MAQDIAVRGQTKLPSLPDWLPRLAIGTVRHPNQPEKAYLAGGLKLTTSQRAEAERCAALNRAALDSADPDRRRAAAIANMILAYPLGGSVGEHASRARGEAYRDALDDMPAWAVIEAVKRWNRGACGDHNYSFAPAPAVLRAAALDLLVPHQVALAKLDRVLKATTLDEAIKPPSPEDRAYVADGFQKLKVELEQGQRAAAPQAEAAE
jgi:hypothetical protein